MVVEQLQKIHADLVEVKVSVQEVQQRLDLITAQFASRSRRFGRIDHRLARIEQRLDPVSVEGASTSA